MTFLKYTVAIPLGMQLSNGCVYDGVDLQATAGGSEWQTDEC